MEVPLWLDSCAHLLIIIEMGVRPMAIWSAVPCVLAPKVLGGEAITLGGDANMNQWIGGEAITLWPRTGPFLAASSLVL